MSNPSHAVAGELGQPFGKPVGSVRRFSLFKWLVAATLLVLLLIVGLNRTQDPGPGDVGLATGPAAVAGGPAGAPLPGSPGLDTLAVDSRGAEIFAIQRAANGQFQVRGHLPDASTRDVWMNAIRRGAQHVPVSDQVQIGDGASESAQWYSLWSSHLLPLTATLRERGLAGLAIEGHRVVVRGQVAQEQERLEIVRLLQGQIPPGFQLDSQLLLAQGDATAGAAATATAAASTTNTAANANASATAATALPAEPGALAGLTGSGLTTPTAPAVSPGAGRTPGAGAESGARSGEGGGAGDTAARSALPGAPLVARSGESVSPVRPPLASRSAAVKCPRTLSSLTTSVHFDTDAAVVSSADRQRLERLGACLGNNRLRIVGRTDPRHTESYNQTLSERRAQAVADAIRSGGADTERLSVVGAGVARQSGSRQNAASLRQSRRVDIQIR